MGLIFVWLKTFAAMSGGPSDGKVLKLSGGKPHSKTGGLFQSWIRNSSSEGISSVSHLPVFLYFGLWLLLKDAQRPVRWKSRPDGRCNACDPCGKRVWVLWLQPCNDGALGTSGVVSCGCCFSHAVRGISQWGHLTGTSLMQDATVHPSHGGSEGTQTSIHCKVSVTQ